MKTYKEDASKVTLDAAKAWLRKEIFDGGATCPCCSQFAKVYKRPFNSSMAYAVIVFAKNLKVDQWVEIPQFLDDNKHTSIVRSREWSRLRFWKLLERREDVREDGSSDTGVYRLTQAGYDFAYGKQEIPHSVYMYNERVLRSDTKKISIRDALGKKFSYDELMLPAK